MSRVCIATSVHPASDTRIYHKEIRSLLEAGHDVTLLAREEWNIRPEIQFAPLPKFSPRWLRILIAPWAVFLEGMKVRADVYHLHDPELLGVGVLWKVFTRARVVFDVHENVVAQLRTKHWVPRWLRRPLGAIYAGLEKILLPFYDAVILAEDSYAPLYAWHQRVHIIHNYPWIPQTTSARRDPPVPLRLIYVGGVTHARGALTMLQAAAILKRRGVSVVWQLVGPASQTLRDDMDAFISDNNLTESVTLEGRLPFPRAQAAVAEADIGISVLSPLPNYVESMPTKLLEYVAAGLPVIASDFPMWRSLLERFECGLAVSPDNAGALADAVQALASDPALRETMGENGRARLEASQMTWDADAQRLNDLYEGMLSK